MMKRICVKIIFLMMILHGMKSRAQELIPPISINATYDQTTNLLFPYAVASVDWGSNGIIVQQRRGAKNILHVKAAKKQFEPTSLTVVTGDGHFYYFVVRYVDTAESLSYQMFKDSSNALARVEMNEASLETAADEVRHARCFLHLSTHVPSLKCVLTGVYVDKQYLWLKMRVENYSIIDFPVGYVRFFLKDKKVIARKVIEEKEMVPVYTDPIKKVCGTGSPQMVFGFFPFTVPKGKRLVVQIGEKGNGRFIELHMKGKYIWRARYSF